MLMATCNLCFETQCNYLFFIFRMNIFVSNLSYGVNDADLRELFEEYGPVSSAKVIMDRETGRSRGFGFVEMGDDEGQKAINELDRAEYDGKVISVSVARPRENNNRGGFAGGGNRGGHNGGGFKPRRSYN